MSIPPPGYVEFSAELRQPVLELRPFGPHLPMWDNEDCPSCGSAPCGPHPLALWCDPCGEFYPCPPVWDVAAELAAVGPGGAARASELLLGLPLPDPSESSRVPDASVCR